VIKGSSSKSSRHGEKIRQIYLLKGVNQAIHRAQNDPGIPGSSGKVLQLGNALTCHREPIANRDET